MNEEAPGGARGRRMVAVFMGTRPEGVKMAPVVAALGRDGDLDCRVVATGQHREMFQQVADQFGFRVDADLGVMRPGQTLAGLTARLMDGIDQWLERSAPDLALVQGDTTTVLVAALACFYRRIPVGHVEAGLRTGDIWSPFPEEANRRLASPIVSLHFAPTASARAALLREGVPDGRIEVTGNTVVDALMLEVARQAEPSVRAAIDAELAALVGADWARVPLVLVTGHRRESFGEGIRQICGGHHDPGATLSRSSLRVPGAPEPERQGRDGPAAGRPGERAADPAAGLPELRGARCPAAGSS